MNTFSDPDTVTGNPKMPHCSELGDATGRYIYTSLIADGTLKNMNTSKRVLFILESNKDIYTSGEEMAKQCGISRNAVRYRS